jgi:MerR family copper efflux transcriptional regulator
MNIGEVAAATGLPAKTIRYYEEIGLVRPPRDSNGYRAFGHREMHRLAFLGRARNLGFPIADCRALLSLWEDRSRASAEVKAIAESHLKEVEAKIRELQALKRTLGHLVESCAGDHRPDCPILDDLSHQAD